MLRCIGLQQGHDAALNLCQQERQGKMRPRFAAHKVRQASAEGAHAAAAAPVRRTPVVRESWGQGAWDSTRNRRGAGGDEVGLEPGSLSVPTLGNFRVVVPRVAVAVHVVLSLLIPEA